MIQPLRRIHRGAFAALALLLPALLASAWRARRPVPSQAQALPPEFLPGAPADPDADALSDVLVYWSAYPAAPGEPLPADAELAGTLRSLGSPQPPPGKPHAVLFDLAHGAVVAPGGAR